MYHLSGKLLINIMKTFILIVATLIINEPVVDESKVFVRDAELREYTIDFLNGLDEYDIDYDKSIPVAVRFSKVMDMSVAGAAMGMMKENEINVIVNEKTWKYLSKEQKRWLIYHELAHDMFDLRHWSTPIMHPQTPSKRKAAKDWEFNKKKLFLTIKHR